jgi:K+/H+ antiporter YhaU regulatory subunit KhtT
MMNMRDSRVMAWGMILLGALLAGCVSGKGVRQLEALEKKYFEGMSKALKDSQEPMSKVLAGTAVNEREAVRQIVAFRSRIDNARRIYSLREMLAAPKSDSAGFIQVTRNKVILYHLAEAVDAQNEWAAEMISVGDGQRKQLTQLYQELVSQTAKVLETEKALHQYLNQAPPQQFADSLAEVGRQLRAFNGELQKADQQNAAIQALTGAGQQAEKRLEQVDLALDKFIELWPQLNKPKER